MSDLLLPKTTIVTINESKLIKHEFENGMRLNEVQYRDTEEVVCVLNDSDGNLVPEPDSDRYFSRNLVINTALDFFNIYGYLPVALSDVV